MTFRKRLLSGARSGKQGRHAKVPLVTAGLGVDSICLVVLQVEFLLHSPRSCPRGWIFNGGDELKDPRAGTGPALDVVQVLAGSEEIRLGAEIGYVHHQRIPPRAIARPDDGCR